jgi:indolepyruvate ferredoxin oxidoreductase, alpha subunit
MVYTEREEEIIMSGEYVLLGAEAVGMAALHAGVSFAYGYPGTPSTEIIEYMQQVLDTGRVELYPDSPEPMPRAVWCSNEKTAYEAAVGVSASGRRALVTMKHVGLNVAADPFMNSVLMNIQGGLVLAVADDPGMHSSQNEQDSRWYADYAKIPCLEPRCQQEAYEMTRLAFDLSEQWHVPVMLKLVTRLSHSRAVVKPTSPRARNPLKKFTGKNDFMVLPSISRTAYAEHLKLMETIESYTEQSEFNVLTVGSPQEKPFAVITTGLGGNYYEENSGDLDVTPDHLHIGMYPLPVEKIRSLAKHNTRIICIEEGYPYVERFLAGLLPREQVVSGKLDGTVVPSGELDPDSVRDALGLPPLKGPARTLSIPLPGRPPQLCQGCPHGDTFNALNDALIEFPRSLVTGDIGCYTLGYYSPYETIETTLCMGASITMARGAADAGLDPVVAVLGDSTFMHSGLTGLVDLVSSAVPVTVFILDNSTTAMTGGQNTIVSSDGLKKAVLGLGVEEAHCLEIIPLQKHRAEHAALIKRELSYRGVSVIIAKRECIQTLKKKTGLQKGVK